MFEKYFSKFTTKLNKVKNQIHYIEEKVETKNGVYEGALLHDNANMDSLNIYTGEKLTGTQVLSYVVSKPSTTPWKSNIKIYSDEPVLYITYETEGDTVEAEDINTLQDCAVETVKYVDEEIKRAKSAENKLTTDLNSEISRAKSAEAKLTTDLNTEISRAENAESTLTTNLNAEISRAQGAESTLTANLTAEANRAKGAESTLTTNLNAEITRAKNAETKLTTDLSSETTRAQGVENGIIENLANEIDRAQTKETEIVTNLSLESERAKTKENVLNDNINSEISRATAKENEIQTALNSEITRATSKENEISVNLNTEISRAQGAENVLTSNLNAEIARAKEKENYISDSLYAEISRATSAELSLNESLNEKINAEKNRAILSEEDIKSIIAKGRVVWEDKYTKAEIENKINQVVSDLDWKESVDTFSDIDVYYAHPQDGWTVNVKDEDITYRYTGGEWIAISANSIPLATNKVDGKMSKNDKAKLDGIDVNANKYIHPNTHPATMIVEDATHRFMTDTERTNLADSNSKKHIHENKSVIDGITSALVNTWNNAYTHISDTVKHITSSERTLWNTVSNKVNKSGDTMTGTLSIKKSGNDETLLTFDTERPWSFKQGGTGANSSLDLISSSGDKSFKVLNSDKTKGLEVRTTPTKTEVKIDGNKVYHAGDKPTKADIGLSNVDNTSDANKPISTATQNALNGKLDKSGGTLTGTLNAQNDIQIPFNVSRIDGSVPYAGSNLPTLSEFTDLSNYKSIMGAITSTGGTWHNILSIRHRNGNGDGNKYGSYVRTNLTTDGDLIWNKQTGTNKWIGERTILDSNNYSRYSATKNHTHTKSQITDMPTKLSQFTNDSGFITRADVDTSQNHTHSNKNVLDGITSAKVTEWNGKANGNHTHNYAGSSSAGGSANSALALKHTPSRPTSSNMAVKGDATVSTFLSTSSMTSNKPVSDGYITHYEWDNTGGYSSQIFLGNNSNPKMQFRGMSNGTWGAWNTIYSTNNKPTPADIGASASNHTHSNYVTLKKFGSTHTGASNNNKWTRIARMRITGQYSDVNALLFLHENGHASGSTNHGMLFCRLKQQNAMGSAPSLQLRLFDESGMSKDQIKMVTVSNTSSETVVDIYYKIYGTHSSINGRLLEQCGGGSFDVYSSQELLTDLPAGTTNGAYRKSFTWNDLKGV